MATGESVQDGQAEAVAQIDPSRIEALGLALDGLRSAVLDVYADGGPIRAIEIADTLTGTAPGDETEPAKTWVNGAVNAAVESLRQSGEIHMIDDTRRIVDRASTAFATGPQFMIVRERGGSD